MLLSDFMCIEGGPLYIHFGVKSGSIVRFSKGCYYTSLIGIA